MINKKNIYIIIFINTITSLSSYSMNQELKSINSIKKEEESKKDYLLKELFEVGKKLKNNEKFLTKDEKKNINKIQQQYKSNEHTAHVTAEQLDEYYETLNNYLKEAIQKNNEYSTLTLQIKNLINDIQEHSSWLAPTISEGILKHLEAINEELKKPASLEQLTFFSEYYNELYTFNESNKQLLQDVMLKEYRQNLNSLYIYCNIIANLKGDVNTKNTKKLNSIKSFFNTKTQELITPNIIATSSQHLNSINEIVVSIIDKKISCESDNINQITTTYNKNSFIDSQYIEHLDNAGKNLTNIQKYYNDIPLYLRDKNMIQNIDKALSTVKEFFDKKLKECIENFENLESKLNNIANSIDFEINNETTKLNMLDIERLIILEQKYNKSIENEDLNIYAEYLKLYEQIKNIQWYDTTLENNNIQTKINNHKKKISPYINTFLEYIDCKIYANNYTLSLTLENIKKTNNKVDFVINLKEDRFDLFEKTCIELTQLVQQMNKKLNTLHELTKKFNKQPYLFNKNVIPEINNLYSFTKNSEDINNGIKKMLSSHLLKKLNTKEKTIEKTIAKYLLKTTQKTLEATVKDFDIAYINNIKNKFPKQNLII